MTVTAPEWEISFQEFKEAQDRDKTSWKLWVLDHAVAIGRAGVGVVLNTRVGPGKHDSDFDPTWVLSPEQLPIEYTRFGIDDELQMPNYWYLPPNPGVVERDISQLSGLINLANWGTENQTQDSSSIWVEEQVNEEREFIFPRNSLIEGKSIVTFMSPDGVAIHWVYLGVSAVREPSGIRYLKFRDEEEHIDYIWNGVYMETSKQITNLRSRPIQHNMWYIPLQDFRYLSVDFNPAQATAEKSQAQEVLQIPTLQSLVLGKLVAVLESLGIKMPRHSKR